MFCRLRGKYTKAKVFVPTVGKSSSAYFTFARAVVWRSKYESAVMPNLANKQQWTASCSSGGSGGVRSPPVSVWLRPRVDVMDCALLGQILASNISVSVSPSSDNASVLFRDAGRLWIHRVIQPMVCLIGLLGNLLTIVVLTRPRMSSSTNTYLTALAVSDIFYLLFTWILTIEHYPDNKTADHFWYWSYWGHLIWLHDAFSKLCVSCLCVQKSLHDLNLPTLFNLCSYYSSVYFTL